MPRLRAAERAFTALTTSTAAQPQHFICHTCRQHLRAIHSTSPFAAEQSFLTRIRNSVFGSKESKEAASKREEARAKRVDELSKQSPEESQGGKAIRDFKGRSFTVAPVVDPSVNKEYVPATSWEGLERIGGEKWVRQRADGGEVYYGFMQQKKLVLMDDEWRKLLHHVAVEVLALQQARRDFGQICYQRANSRSWRSTVGVSITLDGDTVTLSKGEEDPIKDVLRRIPETSQEAGQLTIDLLQEEAQGAAGRRKTSKEHGQIAQEDDAWMLMPISDPAVKLAIIKRTSQLTGHRPRDTAISSAHTLADLYASLKTKEKPKKLAQSNEMRRAGKDNPNVTVRGRRVTPIHKHKAVGRWKLIQDELTARDLPVTGQRFRQAKTQAGSILDGKPRRRNKRKEKKHARN